MSKRRFVAFACALLPSPAFAWWEYGHQTTAEIAYARIKPATRTKIKALLRHSVELDTPSCPARTIKQASVWPDCVKPLKDTEGKYRFGYAYNWHFQNVDICKPFAPSPAFEKGDDILAAIPAQVAILHNRKAKPVDRLRALAFVVHFMGDLHQPLHVGEHDDLGANKVHAPYGLFDGKRTNLHSIWDGWLAERAISSPPPGARGILSGLKAGEATQLRKGDVRQWAEEGWAFSRDVAYASAFHGDPCATPQPPASLDNATIERLIPAVRKQILKGGLRLARVLDKALG